MSMAFNGQKYGAKKPGSPEHSAQPPPPDCSQKRHCASLVFSTKLPERHESSGENARDAVTQVMNSMSSAVIEDVTKIWRCILAFIKNEPCGEALQTFSADRGFIGVSVTKIGQLLYPQHLLWGNSGNGDDDQEGTFAAYDDLANYCKAVGLEFPDLLAFLNTKGTVHGPCRIHFYDTTDGRMGWHLDTFNPGVSDLKFKVIVLIPLDCDVAGSLEIVDAAQKSTRSPLLEMDHNLP